MTVDDTVTAKLAEWEALVPAERWALVGSVIRSAEEGYVGQVSGLRWHDKGEFIAAAPTIAAALLGFVREVLAACEKAKANPAEDGSVKVHTAAIEQALTKWIGGEGRG